MRAFVKAPLALRDLLGAGPRAGVAFLIYHSVAGRTRLELDTPFAAFRRQMERLAVAGGVLAYEEAVAGLASGADLPRGRQVITFDDGYEDTARLAFPVVRDLGLPIAVFATTGLLERDADALRVWRHAARLPPLAWEDLGRMLESGLVTLGAHTHAHPDCDALPEAAVADEIERSAALFRRRLGCEPRHFAYPRARWAEAAEKVVRARYRTAVVGGGTLAVPRGFDPYRIPRVPVRRSDGLLFFGARVGGRLAAEERLYAALHGARRRLFPGRGRTP